MPRSNNSSNRRSSKNSPTVKLSTAQQAEVLLLISKLLKNGFSLNQALKCLKFLEQKPNIFNLIYQDLQNGTMLSTALRHLHLPLVVQNQLAIAQTSGRLQQTTQQCGQILQSKAKQKQKLRELLAYPLFIMGFLIVMIVGMKVYILPQLDSAGSTQQLDRFIQVLMMVGLIVVVAIILLSYRLKKMDEYHRAIFLCKLPLVKTAYLNFYHFAVLQSWGMQFSQGMELQNICQNNQSFLPGSIQSVLSQKILSALKQGTKLESVIDEEILLPEELKMVLFLGASENEVAQDLLILAEMKFEATQKSIKKMLNLIQPVLFGIIAIFILVAYLMILLPVYGMMKGMS